MVKEKRLPVISRQMFRQAHRSFTSDAFNPNKGNPIEFDKQSTQVQLVRVDSWIPEKLMIRFTFRDTLAQGREPVKSTASILFNRPVGDVMQIIPGDVEVERVFDKELGLDSYVPVSKEIIGAVEAINGVSSNKYVFFGYLMMMGEKFTGKEKDLEGLIGDSIKEQVPLLIAGAWDNNLLYKDANPVHLNVATGGDFLEDLTGVGGNNATVTLSDEWSTKGKYSFKVEWDNTNPTSYMSFIQTQIYQLPVAPGDEITFEIDYKSSESFRQFINWRKEDGTSNNSNYLVMPAAPEGGRGTMTRVAPEGTASIYLAIYNTTTPVANTVYVDNMKITIKIRKLSEDLQFFDIRFFDNRYFT